MMRRSKKMAMAIGFLLSLLILMRIITIFPSIIRPTVACLTYPFLIVQNYVVQPFNALVARRQNVDELSKRIEFYKQQLSELLAKNIALQSEHMHARQVNEGFNFAQRYKADHMLSAQVILKQFAKEGHFFLLDAGSARGAQVDMVAVCNNCLIGRVSEVYPWYCKVVLITDGFSKVPAACTTTNAQGIHEGCNNLEETRLEFVSHLQELQIGDVVVSSGDGLVYPKGFAVGKVRTFSLNALGINYIVSVEPLLDLQEINHCFLVSKGAEYLEEAA